MFMAIQPNALWRFNMDFTDVHGTKVGSTTWPDVTEATNARVSFKGAYPTSWTKSVEIVSAERAYRIDYELLDWKWNQDMRFTLNDGDKMIASVDCCHARKLFHRATMHLSAPFNGDLVSHRMSLFAMAFDVLRNGQKIGRIYEKPALVWRRKIFIDVDDSVDVPVQFFLFFLVCNYAIK